MMILATILLISCILKGASAWHGNGHYITAYIAQQWLLENNFEALKWANDLLAPYTDVCGENLYPFVESATWLDKIKDQGWKTYDNQHFTMLYWFDQGAPVTTFAPLDYANSTYGIQDATGTLVSKREDIYGSSKKIFGQSIAMRVLTHLVGDIHQPLHNSERVTPDRPNGDEGGNDFIIKHYDNKAFNNLHFIWDEMFEDYSGSIRTNLPKDKYLLIKGKGDEIMNTYSFKTLEPQILANNTAASWVQEGLQLAKTFVYNNITENTELPDWYQKSAREICYKQAALGGYRLGMLISTIYTKVSKQTDAWTVTLE